MTIAAAAKTGTSLIFVADSVVRIIDLQNEVETKRWSKIGWLKGWGGELILGWSGMATNGDFLGTIEGRLAQLGADAQFDEVFAVFRDQIVPRMTMQAFAAGQPQPAQFLIGGRDKKGLRLAAVEREVIYEPAPFHVVSIGGLRPDSEHPIPWDTPIDRVRGGARMAVLTLVEDYIRQNPSPSYGLPLDWITGYGKLGDNAGEHPEKGPG